jgi:hypothetical protein
MRHLFSEMAAFSAGNLQSGFCRFGTFCVQRWLDLCDKARTQRVTFTVSTLIFVAFLTLPHLSLAQAPVKAEEAPEMTPARFLQMLKDIAALGTLEKTMDIERIVGIELIQIRPKLWYLKRNVEKPAWLATVSAFIDPQGAPQRNWINIRPNKSILCVSFSDVLAAFPGDYFVPSGTFFPRAFTPEEVAGLSWNDVSSGIRREPGPGLYALFFPVFHPTPGQVSFDFAYEPCLVSGGLRIPAIPDPEDIPGLRRVRRQ